MLFYSGGVGGWGSWGGLPGDLPSHPEHLGGQEGDKGWANRTLAQLAPFFFFFLGGGGGGGPPGAFDFRI